MNAPVLRRRLGRRLLFALAAATSIVVASQSSATTSGQSTQGWAFLEGGVGQTETDSMESERSKYSLWIITAGRVSGAHLSDVDVAIVNDKGEQVFERRLDG